MISESLSKKSGGGKPHESKAVGEDDCEKSTKESDHEESIYDAYPGDSPD